MAAHAAGLALPAEVIGVHGIAPLCEELRHMRVSSGVLSLTVADHHDSPYSTRLWLQLLARVEYGLSW